MDPHVLENAGVTRVEAKVYLALVELGSSLAGAITRHSGVQRRTVYDALERLIEKGLVSYIKTNNRKYFQAADPDRLLDIAKGRLDRLQDVLPGLKQHFTMSHEKQETTFFSSQYGLKTVFDDQIATAKEILILGASTNAYRIVKYYFDRYDNIREKKKIPVRIIFSQKIRRKIPLSQVRYLPKEYNSHTATNIYGDKVAIILWTENPFAVLINQKEIAESFRKYFELMWNVAKP
jgi:sugar-specific transcriptional regulator TrmB